MITDYDRETGICDECQNEVWQEDLIETEYGWLCPKCFKRLVEDA